MVNLYTHKARGKFRSQKKERISTQCVCGGSAPWANRPRCSTVVLCSWKMRIGNCEAMFRHQKRIGILCPRIQMPYQLVEDLQQKAMPSIISL